ncbi:MAG: DsbA family protein [Mycobacteriaceae bacterium]|nr:DsbA family protein [Mycobacteriaceae bacterium]
MADKPKRQKRYDLGAAERRRNLAIQIGGTAVVVVFAVALVLYIVTSHNKKGSGEGQAVRVAGSTVITKPGTTEPKVTVSFYEDFLCPACGNFERSFGPTVSKLIDLGAIAADYSMVAILDSSRNKDYPSRAGAAAYCVADESLDAFRRFHTALFSKDIQPAETDSIFPDNDRLLELAREAGAAGKVRGCINGEQYVAKVKGMAAAARVNATPTIKINGQDYDPSTPDAFVAKIKEIVGDVPGIGSAVTPAAS